MINIYEKDNLYKNETSTKQNKQKEKYETSTYISLQMHNKLLFDCINLYFLNKTEQVGIK